MIFIKLSGKVLPLDTKGVRDRERERESISVWIFACQWKTIPEEILA